MAFPDIQQIPAIKSVMTPFPYSIDVEEPISRARELMADHDIRHLPVTRERQLIGMVTEADLSLEPDPNLGVPPEDDPRVGDVCVLEVYVVNLMEPLDRVLLHMADCQIRSALVVKREKLVGIFTMTDACRCLAELLRARFPRGEGGDAA